MPAPPHLLLHHCLCTHGHRHTLSSALNPMVCVRPCIAEMLCVCLFNPLLCVYFDQTSVFLSVLEPLLSSLCSEIPSVLHQPTYCYFEVLHCRVGEPVAFKVLSDGSPVGPSLDDRSWE